MGHANDKPVEFTVEYWTGRLLGNPQAQKIAEEIIASQKSYHERNGFILYSFEDFVLWIKKAGYNHLDWYYVIVEDADTTPETHIMTAEEIKEDYGLEMKEKQA